MLHTKADISRARTFLHWEPKVSFKEGVKLTTDASGLTTSSPDNAGTKKKEGS